MVTKNIHHKIRINAAPGKVYQALMDSKKHAAFTAMKATIENKEGGWFMTCGTNNFGYSLLLEKNKRIVQAWSHKDFPKGHYSIIDFNLEKIKTGTLIRFTHYAAPSQCYKWLNEGWYFAYWNPLKEYFNK